MAVVTEITRVSLTDGDDQAGGGSTQPTITADGRYLVFSSRADNLVPGDSNFGPDAFVRDLVTGTTTRVSVADDGSQANLPDGFSSSYPNPVVSADGRYVAFTSGAANLVPGDTNGEDDVFVRDRVDGTTTRVNVASDESQAAPGFSSVAGISADGRYVTFISLATNLVPGDTNDAPDAFVRDLVAGTTTRVSVADDEGQGNGGSGPVDISASGRYVLFSSGADNLVSGDTNGANDLFLRDLVAGTTTRVSVGDDGSQGEAGAAALSADGRFVVFRSDGALVAGDTNNTQDIFMRDVANGTTTRVSTAVDGRQADSYSDGAAVSPDGRYAAFWSQAANLVPGDSNGFGDVFVKDLQTGAINRLSLAADGSQYGGFTLPADLAFTADGRQLAFDSLADNLVSDDTNSTDDIFLIPVDFTVRGRVEADVWDGSANPDWNGSAVADTWDGNAGDDVLNGRGGDDKLIGDAGADRLTGDVGNDSLVGDYDGVAGGGDDVLDGGAGNDRLVGSTGDDVLSGGDGRDELFGGADADEVDGGLGDDNLRGNDGDDRLGGGEGNDLLDGGAGTDGLQGGTGDDRLSGVNGDDVLSGGAGRDTLDGGDGGDEATGGADDDILRGGAGGDDLDGGDGIDRLQGGTENDVLSGAAGNDTLLGEAGDDALAGGLGADRLEGGAGVDRLLYTAAGQGGDTAYGFRAGSGGDVIDVGDLLDALGYAGDDPIGEGVVRVEASGRTATRVVLDADGTRAGAGETLVTLASVAPSAFDVAANLDVTLPA